MENEVMNEEVVEEVVENVTSVINDKNVFVGVGLGAVISAAGYAVYRFLIKPGINKVKSLVEDKKDKNDDYVVIETSKKEEEVPEEPED